MFCFFCVLCEGDHGKVGVNTAEAALSHLALQIFSSFKLPKFWIKKKKKKVMILQYLNPNLYFPSSHFPSDRRGS